jgi:hypothetical protein
VTYRIQFEPPALLQLNGFPGDALEALVPVMVDVSLYPADPLRTVPVPSRPGQRQAVFGGVGLVTYEIDEGRRVVMVTDVTWAG